VKYWETIADNLHKAGWSLGWVSALDVQGRTIWIVDGHRDDGKRFVVRADEKLTAFMELELAIRAGQPPTCIQYAKAIRDAIVPGKPSALVYLA
jgi:hypothetical protein